jgi:RNA polymerase II subunit A small phosphatase-like protein
MQRRWLSTFLRPFMALVSSLVHRLRARSPPVLVLDLGDTIIRATRLPTAFSVFSVVSNRRRLHIQVRPGAIEFLQTMAKSFDVRIFSDFTRDITLQIVRHIAPFVPERCCYSIEDCVFQAGYVVKDLRRIGYPLDRVLLLDDVLGSGLFQPANCLQIAPWHGDQDDDVLKSELAPILIACWSQDDVIGAVRKQITEKATPNLKIFRI